MIEAGGDNDYNMNECINILSVCTKIDRNNYYVFEEILYYNPIENFYFVEITDISCNEIGIRDIGGHEKVLAYLISEVPSYEEVEVEQYGDAILRVTRAIKAELGEYYERA